MFSNCCYRFYPKKVYNPMVSLSTWLYQDQITYLAMKSPRFTKFPLETLVAANLGKDHQYCSEPCKSCFNPRGTYHYLLRFDVDFSVIKSKEIKFSWHGENLRLIKLFSHMTKVRNTKESTELRSDIQMFTIFSTWVFNRFSVSRWLPLLFLSWGFLLFH